MSTAVDLTRDKVASYGTFDAATRAAARLVEVGFEESEVSIAPRGYHEVESGSLRQRVGRAVRTGALAGAIAAGGVSLFSTAAFDSIVGTIVPSVALGLGVGLVVGALIGLLRHFRARRVTFGGPRAELAPDHFDVTVRRAADRANHELARWWDPSAVPAGWKRSA